MNSVTARANILAKLRKSDKGTPAPASDFSVIERKGWDKNEQLSRFCKMMGSVNGEIHHVNRAEWATYLHKLLASDGIENLIYGPGTEVAYGLEGYWPNLSGGPKLLAYNRPIEEFKEDLFASAAGITTTKGGIAETGSLILWPTEKEPRLLSLVPPIHVALLDSNRLYDTFFDAMKRQGWGTPMPTNALLVSGPSKTADIEQTLTYGVHGPKRLIVLILTDSEGE